MYSTLMVLLVWTQASISSVAKTIDKHKSLNLVRKRKASQAGLEPSVESVKAICSYAHKICYTSFALPGNCSGVNSAQNATAGSNSSIDEFTTVAIMDVLMCECRLQNR